MQDMYELNEQEKKQVCDLELGIIGTGNILDFFQGVLGCRVYNKALDDAKKFYEKYADNMETDYYALYRDVR